MNITLTPRDQLAVSFLKGIIFRVHHTDKAIWDRCQLAYLYADRMLYVRDINPSEFSRVEDMDLNEPKSKPEKNRNPGL